MGATMLDIGTCLRHYKREDVQNEMVAHAVDKEVAFKYRGEGFGKRPDILKYPNDIIELVKQGVTSFHASEELWHNPLQLDPLMKKQEIEELRKGWDLVIDIDSQYFPYSKIAADLIVKALKHFNITAISIKFSGNKGFHIGVPFEAFPKMIAGEDVSKKFPEDIRGIADHITKMIAPIFIKKVVEIEGSDAEKIASNLKKKKEDILKGNAVDMLKILDIDTILISSRHLYRMPYSLHEKSGLVSIPIDPDGIMGFEKCMAHPDNIKVKPNLRFLNRENISPNQAKELFDRVTAERTIEQGKLEFQKKEIRPVDIPESAVPEQFFPPCVQLILKGVDDGRKRSLFLLTNFLVSVGWSYDDIEKRLDEWNKKNPEPLREVNIKGQLRYHKQQKRRILPPNCQNQMYYKDFGVCKPDQLCQRIKNPVQYAKRKTFYLKKEKTGKNPAPSEKP